MSANDSIYPSKSLLDFEENDTLSYIQDYSNNADYYIIDKDFMDVFYKVIIYGVIPPIAAFGIAGNILILLIVFRQNLKRSTTVLIISVAIADLAFIGVTIINSIEFIISDLYPDLKDEIRLKMIIPFAVYILPLPARISNLLVTTVTLERMIAVIYPLKVRKLCTKKLVTVLVVVISIIAAVLQLPKLWLYEIKDITLPDGNVSSILTFGILGRQKQLFEIYYITTETLLRFIPIGVIVIANSIIIGVIVKQAKWRRLEFLNVRKLSIKDLQITKTLLTITCIYVVCLIPSTVPRLAVLFDPDSSHYRYSSNIYFLLSVIGLVTETLNASINIIVYVSMSTTYRMEFYKICGKMYRKKITTATTEQYLEHEKNGLYRARLAVLNSGREETHM